MLGIVSSPKNQEQLPAVFSSSLMNEKYARNLPSMQTPQEILITAPDSSGSQLRLRMKTRISKKSCVYIRNHVLGRIIHIYFSGLLTPRCCWRQKTTTSSSAEPLAIINSFISYYTSSNQAPF